MLTEELVGRFQWQGASVILGVMVLALLIPIAIVIRKEPKDLSLHPDGEDPRLITQAVDNGRAVPDTASAAPLPSMTTKEAMKTVPFWALFISIIFVYAAFYGVLVHLVSFLTDIGLSFSRSAKLFSLMSIAGVISSVLFGFWAERVRSRYLLLSLAYIVQALALVILIIGQPALGSLLSFILFYGLTIGGNNLLLLVTADCFGVASYGTIFGLMMLSSEGGGFLGTIFAGKVYDLTGNYQWAFIAFAIGLVVATAMNLFARRPSEKH